ncbi:hypothetical protein [Cohaesibacter intestini]|uniref:hypothetical protein n=1 Tax=Cohaesibacter intestini TaxID=2211145 RepID=UPI000DE8167B|nr:hypothetical protein [Cohaesibacter intestini]
MEQNAPGTCGEVCHKTGTSGSQSVLDDPKALHDALTEYDLKPTLAEAKGITPQVQRERIYQIYTEAIRLQGLLIGHFKIANEVHLKDPVGHEGAIHAMDSIQDAARDLCGSIVDTLDEVSQ